MIWWGHGSSGVVIVLLLATFVLRALAVRRRPGPGGQRSSSTAHLVPPGHRAGPAPGPPGAPTTGQPGGDHAVGSADRPSAPQRPGFTGVAPGWLPDPTARHDRRYWSGSEWTEHVTSGGVPGTDPPPSAAPTGGDGGGA